MGLIGHGRVGSALTEAASSAGFNVQVIERGSIASGIDPDLVALLLAVPDYAIREVVDMLADAENSARFVGHVSGATPLSALDALTARGAQAFSIHPLQTFSVAGTPLAGVPCATAGSNTVALEFARALADELGMKPFSVPEHKRALYHAAASMASNFLITLEESAAALFTTAEVQDGRSALARLVRTSLENWLEKGPDALTGPIARGDVETVDRHREAISHSAPDVLALYDALAARTALIAHSPAGRAAQ